MTDLMTTDVATFAAAIFVAVCVLWLVWRALRSLFRPHPSKTRDIGLPPEPDARRREPTLSAAPAPTLSPSVPDAADVLALKASIDALARQIGLLEKRLGPANTNVPPATAPRPAREAAEPPRREVPETPVIVPDRRI